MNPEQEPHTEREEDVGPPVPTEPPMIDLIEVEDKIKDFFSRG